MRPAQDVCYLQLEMQVAILNQEMLTAAGNEKFEEAAKYRDRLETLRLKQRCMQVEHREGLRNSICHHIGVQSSYFLPGYRCKPAA